MVYHCRIPQGSREDLLAYSQAVYDQLTPLSSSIQKLCACKNGKTICSYKQYNECKTKTRGKVYHCVLHSSSRKKRDLHHAILFKENSLRPEERTVSKYTKLFIIIFFYIQLSLPSSVG